MTNGQNSENPHIVDIIVTKTVGIDEKIGEKRRRRHKDNRKQRTST
jgi:hypothetical protein